MRIAAILTVILACLAGLPAQAATAAPPLKQTDIQAAYYKSYGYERTQNYVDAIKALQPVLDAFPEGYTVNLRLGWLNYLKGSFADSVALYQKAVQKAPNAIEAKLGLMNPLMAQAKRDEAIQVAQQILAVDHFNRIATQRLGDLLVQQNKLDQAEKVYRDILALYPTDVAALASLAVVKATQKDAVAADIFSDVLVLDPENVAAKRYFGVP